MLRIIRLWVIFIRFPLYYWADENLGCIASYIRKHICTMTTEIERVSFSKVLIEEDITQELSQELFIERTDGIVITQAIKYEWTPQFWHTCMKMGHKEGERKQDKTTNPMGHQPRRKKPLPPL